MEVTSPRTKVGLSLLEDGSNSVKAVVQRYISGGLEEEDAAQINACLFTLRSAVDRLDGTAYFEEAHRALDFAGRVQRVLFRHKCVLRETDGTYYDECPVSLAHTRVGISAGLIIEESVCSICNQDSDLCPHIAGREYDGSRCQNIITKVKADHVAFVENPDFPDARFTAMSIDYADIVKGLKAIPPPGALITCDRCLDTCTGVNRPFQNSTESPPA